MPASRDAREHAAQQVDRVLVDLHNRGCELRNIRSKYYATPSGRTVVVPFSNPDKHDGDHWFWGATVDNFDLAILVAADSDGTLLTFVLDADFIMRHRRRFSRSGNQVKFNVRRRGRRFYATIGGEHYLLTEGVNDEALIALR